jgi:hypothetical protein
MANDVSNDPRPVLRQELARVFKNQRVIRAFEKIFDLIPPEFINQQDQIDAIVIELSTISTEFDQLPNSADIREELAELRKTIDGLAQGPVI